MTTTEQTRTPAPERRCGHCGGSRSPTGRDCRCEPADTCELECLERPMFTAGMVLSDSDLTALTDWAGGRFGLVRQRDGWGVVCGLDVHCDPDRPASVVVEPGYAVGCCGEDIVLCETQTIDLAGCCRVESPCAQPVEDPKKPDRDPDPCGDVVVDIVLSPLASLARPELIETCTCGCDQEAHVAPTRQREGGLVEPIRVAFPKIDPRDAAAARADADYRSCHAVVRRWVEAGARGIASRDDVVRWLRDQCLEPPCDWWETTCEALAGADGEAKVDEVVAGALFDLVVACRHRLLRQPCSTCTDGRIGLARVWLRRVERTSGPDCVVTRVDAYRPHRRELSRDARPVPVGAEDLAPFIWQRWDEVCVLWRHRAPDSARLVTDVPASTGDLLQLLDASTRLWWRCGEPPPQPVVVRTSCLGERVIGFQAVEGRGDPEGLEAVHGIGPVYARTLRESGTSTIEELAMRDPTEIAEVLRVSEKVAAESRRNAVEHVRNTR